MDIPRFPLEFNLKDEDGRMCMFLIDTPYIMEHWRIMCQDLCHTLTDQILFLPKKQRLMVSTRAEAGMTTVTGRTLHMKGQLLYGTCNTISFKTSTTTMLEWMAPMNPWNMLFISVYTTIVDLPLSIKTIDELLEMWYIYLWPSIGEEWCVPNNRFSSNLQCDTNTKGVPDTVGSLTYLKDGTKIRLYSPLIKFSHSFPWYKEDSSDDECNCD